MWLPVWIISNKLWVSKDGGGWGTDNEWHAEEERVPGKVGGCSYALERAEAFAPPPHTPHAAEPQDGGSAES